MYRMIWNGRKERERERERTSVRRKGTAEAGSKIITDGWKKGEEKKVFIIQMIVRRTKWEGIWNKT